jgi:hypothetical protein
VTLLDPPIAVSSAERCASANFIANCCALARTQPNFARTVLPPRTQVEWVFGRDGTLSALDEDGNWWAGCSLPTAAGAAMLKKMDVNAAVSCFLAPPHAAHLRIALDKVSPEQAIIAVVPEEADVRLLLSCEDFSQDIAAHRLWLAGGPTWALELEEILREQIGLAVPAQFLRLHSTADAVIQKLIQEATAVFSQITVLRSRLIGQVGEIAAGRSTQSRKFCVMAPRRFRLWNDEGFALSNIAPADSVLLDTSDPALSSPLKLATTAVECGALLAPNFARADMPGALPANVAWFTWITNDRIPSFQGAGANDRLLIATPSVRAAAIAAGWPAERVHVAGWPHAALPPAKGRGGKRILTVLADTLPVTTPANLEDFSSHRVLWETIQRELSQNPFSLEGDPGAYLLSRMHRFDIAADAFPHDRFLSQLIVPAYQQSIVRQLVKAGLPLRLHGEGWSEIEEFESCAVGPLHSHEEVAGALGEAAILVDLWPWRAGHPINGVNRLILRGGGCSVPVFIQRARNILAAAAAPASPATASLSTQLLADLLRSCLPLAS